MNYISIVKDSVKDTLSELQKKIYQSPIIKQSIEPIPEPIPVLELEPISEQLQEIINDTSYDEYLSKAEFNDYIIKENAREYKEILTTTIELNEIMSMLSKYTMESEGKVSEICYNVNNTSNNSEKGLKEIIIKDKTTGFF